MSAASFSIALLIALLLSVPYTPLAQGGAAVYVIQFHDLKAQMKMLSVRADALVERSTPQQKLVFGQDSLALVKLINKLGQDAAGSNLSGLKQGRVDDKTLLLVDVAAEALGVEKAALDAFVETGDRSFKAAAHDADMIATNLEKGM
jgi:hypothetical protein